MKIILWMALVPALLLAGFAAGFPIGKSMGFTAGSEWAFVQADILAREVGFSLPVDFKEGWFRIIIKQPPNIYKKAWRLADMHEEMESMQKAESATIDIARLERDEHASAGGRYEEEMESVKKSEGAESASSDLAPPQQQENSVDPIMLPAAGGACQEETISIRL